MTQNCKNFCIFIVGLKTFHKTRLHIRYRSLITMYLRCSEYLYILQPASVHLDTTALWRVKMDTLAMVVGASANVMIHKHVNRISDVLKEAIIIMVSKDIFVYLIFFLIMYMYLHTCKFENICLYKWKSCIRDVQPSIIILHRFYTERQLHVCSYCSCHCGYPFRACNWNSFVYP